MDDDKLAFLDLGAVIDNVIVDARGVQFAALVKAVSFQLAACNFVFVKGTD